MNEDAICKVVWRPPTKKEFIEMYGDIGILPDPEHCPKEFEFYVELYKFIKEL